MALPWLESFNVWGDEPRGKEPSSGNLDSRHGAFTMAALKALAGEADRDGDTWLSDSELDGYVVRRVPRVWRGGGTIRNVACFRDGSQGAEKKRHGRCYAQVRNTGDWLGGRCGDAQPCRSGSG